MTFGILKSISHITSFCQLSSRPNRRGTLVYFGGIEDNVYCIQKLRIHNVDVHLTRGPRHKPLNIDVTGIFLLKTLLCDQGKSHCSLARIPSLTSPLMLLVSSSLCTFSRFSHPLRTWNVVPLACAESRVFFLGVFYSSVKGGASYSTCLTLFGHHSGHGQRAFLGPYTRKGFRELLCGMFVRGAAAAV